jgi:signal transduction histidine kinase
MLRTRLFINLLPFVVMVLAIGLYAIALFSKLGRSVDTSVTGNYRSIIAAQAMGLELAALEKEAWFYAGTPRAGAQPFVEHQKRFEDNLALQARSSSTPQETALTQTLSSHYQELKRAMGKLLPTTPPSTQRSIYEQAIVPQVLAINKLLEQIRDLNQMSLLATSQNIENITRRVTRLMIAGIVIALIISAYACYQLSRAILKPIQALTRATRELSEGNLGQPVPVTSRDELGELAVAFNKMAARLQEYRLSTTEKIVSLHRIMETTLASFPDPIFVLNKQGEIELKNPAAQELQSALQLDGALPPRLQALARRTVEKGEDFLPNSFKEVSWHRLGQTDKFFLPRILAMHDKQGAFSGVAVVLYDVTRFRLLDSAKTNLVATVSHELKTPLTGLRMGLHILLEKTVGELNPKQEELLQASRDDTERLLKILNDLLDLTRLDEGYTDLRMEKISPGELLEGVGREMEDQAAMKGLKINRTVEPNLPSVSVDRQRITHVFTNLIGNAIKHSPERSEISLRARAYNGEDVAFSVADQGPGIPEEYQSRIFDRFFRVPGQTKTGAGLGLSIAREITVAHGGRIGVTSAPGRGSTFYVVLKGEA